MRGQGSYEGARAPKIRKINKIFFGNFHSYCSVGLHVLLKPGIPCTSLVGLERRRSAVTPDRPELTECGIVRHAERAGKRGWASAIGAPCHVTRDDVTDDLRSPFRNEIKRRGIHSSCIRPTGRPTGRPVNPSVLCPRRHF